MTDSSAFKIDLGSLKSRSKEVSPSRIAASDAIAEDHGFVSRPEQGRRGRKPSPRTGQVHAKVLPHIAEEIAEEARRRGVTQGVIIEEAWLAYRR